MRARWVVEDFSCLQRYPFISLHPNANCEQCRANDEDFPSHFLTLVHLGFCGPVEEFDNIFGHL